MPNKRLEILDIILMFIIGIAFIINLIIINISESSSEQLVLIGYTLLLCGILLFIIAFFTQINNKTHTIIKSGIYALARHPMYLGAMVMFISHIFFSQSWIVVISTTISVACCYLITITGDKRNIEKYGDDYKQYITAVPRINIFSGLIRLVQQRKNSS
jgi:protein-S-isoprenylcysteine O-methyltransferase Ste14